MPFFQKSGTTLNQSRVNLNYLNPGLELVGFNNFGLTPALTQQITTFDARATSPFSSNNLNYRLVIQEVTSAAASTLFLKMRLSGTDTISNSYFYGGLTVTDAGVVNTRNVFGSSPNGMRIGTTDTVIGLCATVDIISPFASGSTCFMVEAREAGGTFSGGGTFTPATSYNELSLSCSSNITGKMMLYAWRDGSAAAPVSTITYNNATTTYNSGAVTYNG